MISLFHEEEPVKRSPFSILGSVLAHGGVGALICWGILATPPLQVPRKSIEENLQFLNLRKPRPDDNNWSKKLQSALHSASLPDKATSAEGSAPQTFVRPDVSKPNQTAEKLPLPALLLWQHKHTNDPTVTPQQNTAPLANIQQSSLTAPNQEQDVADQQSAAGQQSLLETPLRPAHSAPLPLAGNQPQNGMAETQSVSTQQPNPGSVLSASDLQPADGTIALPTLNEIAGNNGEGHGNARGSDAGKNSLASSKAATPLRHLIQPNNGSYSMVIVGNSMEEQYPETATLWSGRMAYSVFLHIGTAHNWVLQYARPTEPDASVNGDSGAMSAPWPVDLVIPALDPAQMTADALLVHGFIEKDGSVQLASVAYPPEFPQTDFVLNALRQWHFRPASTNGHPARVEILLIIPAS